MSAVLDIPGRAHAPRPAVTQLGVVRSEWTKFRSLRSTVWTLLIALVLMVGIGALFSAVTASQLGQHRISDFHPISASLSGVTLAQLAFGVLGVLLISGEYSTGMIRSSLTAVPRRLPVLWGKVGVFSGAVLAVSLVGSVASFLIGQALFGEHGRGVSITSPDALRSVIGAALYVTVAGLIGMAIGALLRSTAAAISTFVAVFFVLPPLASLLPSSVADWFVPYLPSSAGAAVYGGASQVHHALSAWSGFAVLCAYAIVLLGAAAARLRRTDA